MIRLALAALWRAGWALSVAGEAMKRFAWRAAPPLAPTRFDRRGWRSNHSRMGGA